MSDPSRSNDPRPSPDSSSPYDTDELRPIYVPAPPPSSVTPSSVTPVSPFPTDEGYALEGGPLPDDEDLPPPVPVAIPSRPQSAPPRPKPKLEFERPEPEGTSEFEAEVSEVDPTWTRWGEWGPDLIRVGAVGLGTVVVSWMAGSFLLFLVGLAAMVLLSYPLLITLERPVRITPEQAVNDYFAAASHHFPHYRRMWLLLSSLGRESARFSTFDQFRAHWQAQIDRWKQTRSVGKFTPLKFEVENFQAARSTGKETSKADYTVHVYIRDRESEGPIETFRMIHGLVKGPDKMWYLNRSVLENRSR